MSVPLVTLINTNLIKPPIAPLGLDYLAQSLQERHLKVDMLDLCFSDDPLGDIKSYFRKNQPRILGITVRNTDDCVYASRDSFLPRIKKVLDEIKKQSDAPIVLGGCGFSIMPEEILTYLDVDLGIMGDSEESFPLLVHSILEGKNIERVSGLVQKDTHGPKMISPPDLDLTRLPLQNRDFVDNKRYFAEGGMGAIETKRGCDQGCIYCADPLTKGRKIRLRPAAHVVWELKRLVQKGIDFVHISDSEFNLPSQHAEEICHHMITQKLGARLHWYAYCSPYPFTENLARLMQKAGCSGINFGVDSGNDRMLARLGRSFSPRDIERTAKLCQKYDIVFMYDLLLGGPGENKETLKDTIELMKELSPDRVGVTVGIRVYPGTSLSRSILEEGSLEKNPHLHGEVLDRNFLEPTFYLSSEVSDEIFSHVERILGNDERFLFPRDVGKGRNYNYNQNTRLIRAIHRGARGAYWDILRRFKD